MTTTTADDSGTPEKRPARAIPEAGDRVMRATVAGLRPGGVAEHHARVLLDALPPDGAKLSELVDRAGLRDIDVLRAAMLLLHQHRARWRGGRLVPEPVTS